MEKSAPPPPPRSEQTRAAILESAERQFARRGFAAARLEDIAREVGIRRASIVYYYKDKAELYDAVLHETFGAFATELDASLLTPGPPTEAIEAAVLTWIDYLAARPSFGRILLREIADAAEGTGATVRPHLWPFIGIVERFIAAHKGHPDLVKLRFDAPSIASTIAGTTVFFAAAMPALLPDYGFGTPDPEPFEKHKREVIELTRRLLAQPEEDDA